MPRRSRICTVAIFIALFGVILARADAQTPFVQKFLMHDKGGKLLAQADNRPAEESNSSDSKKEYHLKNGAWRQFERVWNFELTSAEGRPITLGKIAIGTIILLVGLLLSRGMSRAFGQRFLPRVGMNASAAAALQTVVFYILVATFVLFALDVVNIPLTVFAFLGGAVAIGVGFGSQNIINNFISGLILLAERPIRVSDVIELSGTRGTVQKIGARSTRVRTGSNVDIIVPNSSFLENNVTNWTLSDDRIRSNIDIGVAYGSPTRDVKRLLLQAADEHDLVMKVPEPFVWFTAFGDSTLNFSLYVWIRMTAIGNRMRIESDLRFRIDELFREAKISIAFPQRDVHLDTKGPLEIKMVEARS